MDPSRFQRTVDALREANAVNNVAAITAALEDLSRATYRDYTIKSFLVEAGAIAALVAASEALPWDGTANDAHSAVALCLWGLMIGHKPNKIKLVEQGGLPVLIRGLDKSAHEDCAQYSALAIWSLSYSVPENQLAAGASISALKALLEHPNALVQYAAAGALWAVSSHPHNRKQLILDQRLLATLLLFLPEAAPPVGDPPTLEASAPLPAQSPELRPVDTNRESRQPRDGDASARALFSGAPSLSEPAGAILYEEGTPGEATASERAGRSDGAFLFRGAGPSGLVRASETPSPSNQAAPAQGLLLSEFPGPPTSPAPSDPALSTRFSSQAGAFLAPPRESYSDAPTLQLPPSEVPRFSGRADFHRGLRENWLMATERLSENLQRQSDLLGRRTRRLRGLSGTAPTLSEAAAAATGVNEPLGGVNEAPSRSSGVNVPPSGRADEVASGSGDVNEPPSASSGVNEVPSTSGGVNEDSSTQGDATEGPSTSGGAIELPSERSGVNEPFTRSSVVQGDVAASPSAAALGSILENPDSGTLAGSQEASGSLASAGERSSQAAERRAEAAPDMSGASAPSVASGLGSESADVWSAQPENSTLPAPRPASAIEELRTLVRAERARAEAFVARARALVDEERAIRGNITSLERELAVAVRERDAAVAERDRTSAVLGRALEALSSARDQLAALGGSLRASNHPPLRPVLARGRSPPAPGGQTEEYELLEMLDAQTETPSPDPQQGKKACLMACLLLGNLSLCQLAEAPDVRTVFEGGGWSEAMTGVLRFVQGLAGLDAFWATMLWTTVQPLVDLLQSPEPAVQALSLYIVVDLCTGNEHKHKFILEGAVSHLGRLCSSSSALVRRLARSALLQLGIRPSTVPSAEEPPKAESSLGPLEPNSDDVSDCVICCDEVSTASFTPCGHVVSCMRCAQCLVARGDRCPLCRKAIGSVNMHKVDRLNSQAS